MSGRLFRNGTSEELRQALHGSSEAVARNPLYFADQLDRFSRNFISEQQLSKQKRLAAYDRKLLKKRIATEEVEAVRRSCKELQQRVQTERLDRRRHLLSEGLKPNKNYQPIDPLTHKYRNSEVGLRLKYVAEEKQVRDFARADRLVARGGSKFDPLSGARRPEVEGYVPVELVLRFRKRKEQLAERELVRL